MHARGSLRDKNRGTAFRIAALLSLNESRATALAVPIERERHAAAPALGLAVIHQSHRFTDGTAGTGRPRDRKARRQHDDRRPKQTFPGEFDSVHYDL
jgi:hypothetical protein